MRLKLLLRDKEYRDNLINLILGLEEGIFVEIGKNLDIEDNTLIITDLSPTEIGKERIALYDKNIVFLTNKRYEQNIERNEGPYYLFKYERLSKMVAILRLYYFMKFSDSSIVMNKNKFISIFSDRVDTNKFSYSISKSLIYKLDKKPFFLPMQSMIRDGKAGNNKNMIMAKLIYYSQKNIAVPPDFFSIEDCNGIFSIDFGRGINPMIKLDDERIEQILCLIARCGFDFIICDFGNNLCNISENIIRNSEFIFLVTEKFDNEKYIMEITNQISEGEDMRIIGVNENNVLENPELEGDNQIVKVFLNEQE